MSRGIHPMPNQATGGNRAGNGPGSGDRRPLRHTVEQVYWLSASRNPISGAGTTPFAPDLQTWTRDAISPNNLAPDWLRVGTDIVDTIGVPVAPTFNAAFSLDGTVPEPSTVVLVGSSLIGFAVHVARRRHAAT